MGKALGAPPGETRAEWGQGRGGGSGWWGWSGTDTPCPGPWSTLPPLGCPCCPSGEVTPSRDWRGELSRETPSPTGLVPKIKMTDLMFGSDRNPTQPHKASVSQSPFSVGETEAQSNKSTCPLSLRQQRPEPGLELMCEGSQQLPLDPRTTCLARSRPLIPGSEPSCDAALPRGQPSTRAACSVCAPLLHPPHGLVTFAPSSSPRSSWRNWGPEKLIARPGTRGW